MSIEDIDRDFPQMTSLIRPKKTLTITFGHGLEQAIEDRIPLMASRTRNRLGTGVSGGLESGGQFESGAPERT